MVLFKYLLLTILFVFVFVTLLNHDTVKVKDKLFDNKYHNNKKQKVIKYMLIIFIIIVLFYLFMYDLTADIFDETPDDNLRELMVLCIH